MSWPHILSLSRVAASGPIAALILIGNRNSILVAACLFGIVSITDLLDGPLARHVRAVGPFGIYLDTTGDKVLVSVVLIAMAASHILDAWIVSVIVGREFLVSGVRTLAAVEGVVISANFAGKVKTTVTLIAMFVLLIAAASGSKGLLSFVTHVSAIRSVGWIGMMIATALTVYSGAKYIVDARRLFTPQPASQPLVETPETQPEPSAVEGGRRRRQ